MKIEATYCKHVGSLLKAVAISSSLLLLPAAVAQQAPPQQNPIIQEAQAVEQSLQAIQQAALEENPQLLEMQEDYEAAVHSTMKELGVDPDQDMDRLREIQTEATDQELNEEDRQSLVSEFQQVRQRLMQAEQQAMQTEEVSAKREELQEAVVTAMIEHDPETEALFDKQQKLRQQIMQQQGQGPRPQPQQP